MVEQGCADSEPNQNGRKKKMDPTLRPTTHKCTSQHFNPIDAKVELSER
jgi:hypothetical protein